MCGRYASARSDVDLIEGFGIEEVLGAEPAPSWNVAPTQDSRVVLERALPGRPPSEAVRQLRTMRWGLVPSWAKTPKIGSKMINARLETLVDKPAFRVAVSKRRLVVPADGYYEWQTVDGAKVPHFLQLPGQGLAFAGLYEMWRDPTRAADDPDRWLWTYTILTTTAPDALGHIHDRSPVLVPDALLDAWLDPELTDTAAVRDLLASMPEPLLVPHVVSRAVNNVVNNGPSLRVEADLDEQQALPL
ncbi:SOS response-associated peptidase [Acidothermaceae bacterium B102]|nr:SOS response-associated peptidase [Acidothermaceae bacterium B102]